MKRIVCLIALSLIVVDAWAAAKPKSKKISAAPKAIDIPAQPQVVELGSGWLVQAAAQVSEPGETIASPASTPALVPDLRAGHGHGRAGGQRRLQGYFLRQNLETIPEGQFKSPWWYRQEFELPQTPSFSTPGWYSKASTTGPIYS